MSRFEQAWTKLLVDFNGGADDLASDLVGCHIAEPEEKNLPQRTQRTRRRAGESQNPDGQPEKRYLGSGSCSMLRRFLRRCRRRPGGRRRFRPV
jgi:hypothetical protein